MTEVGDDVYVFWGDYRLTRIDRSGTTHDEACTVGLPQTSPSGARVALARIPCPDATGQAAISVSGPSGDRILPVVGTLPRLLGVDDDGTVVYVDLRGGDYRDIVRVIDPDGRDRVVRHLGYVHDYDPVHHVLLATLRIDIGARAGGAMTLDGDLLWSSDRTSVQQASPDGRYAIVSRIPTRDMFYPPRSRRPLVNPRVVDTMTGETVLELPEVAADGALVTAYQFDDDDHVLAEAWRHHRHRFVRISLDGTVTDAHPDLSGPRLEPAVIFESR
ncbi:hypothetical protein BH11ACT8_BH11ACT8_29620 [soil metagenome]